MNKFAILAVCAFAAVACVCAQEAFDEESQAAAIRPNDVDEVANLPENQKDFEQFCRDTRDYVWSDIRTTSDSLSSRMFATIFGVIGQMGQEAVGTLDKSTQRISGSLRNPSSEIAPAEDEAEQIVAEAQQNIAGQSQPVAFLTGFKAAVSAVSRNVGSMLSKKLDEIKSMVRVDQLSNMLTQACVKIAEYEEQLKDQFNDAQKDLAVSGVTFESVQCVTLRRISRLDGFCRLATAARQPVGKMFG